MDTTIFLASIWGPIILAMGLGIFVSRSYYVRIYRDLEKDALAVLTFGMLAMAVGIIQIKAHDVWNNLPEIVVSLIGWMLLVKGAMFTIIPRVVDKSGDWVLRTKLMIAVGVMTLIIGAYLSWIAYIA
jgi:hypothetical protein